MLRLSNRTSSAVCRFRIDVKVTLGRARSIADTRETFWSAYRTESAGVGESRTYAWYEQRLRSNFPGNLQTHLRRAVPDISVVFTDLRYGSLELTLTAISAGFAALGLTTDDAARLVQQYVPLAFAETLESGNIDVDFDTRVECEASEPAVPRAESAPSAGRLMWIAANTTLLLPAVILLVGAFLLFRTASDTQRNVLAGALADRKNLTEAVVAERARLTDALVKEKAEIDEDRRRRVSDLAARIKALEGQIADMNLKWAQLLTELQKARAKPAVNTKPSRRR